MRGENVKMFKLFYIYIDIYFVVYTYSAVKPNLPIIEPQGFDFFPLK